MKRKGKASEREDRTPTLKDSLNVEMLSKLKETKKNLVNLEAEREQEKKREQEKARLLREQSKSFEELLEESPQNWQDYKK
ncbi:YqkE family protein [Jeotgalibacillus sp. ET6]|uniref:YqkE family protein n=1 Tax=Jeotgalibacillus sp. ET6 TaxID=3037260 RepID=UPI0024182DDE|nr:YqkE family protein [Jeotgalibacillus sp. ET6]MDG5470707.1 YqkE family protein [Jeotgalibacillus sp. ET6]